MGVPKLFRWLSNKYPQIISNVHSNNMIEYLFFDLNGLIHPVCRSLNNQSFNEQYMYERIKKYIIYIVNLVKPSKAVYLIMDGVAPYAKILQQRQRRYKSIDYRKRKQEFCKKYNIPYVKEWDSNAISPGTNFMKKLSLYLHTHFVKNKSTLETSTNSYIINDTLQIGEGEHKIIEIIYSNNLNNVCIYGLDADLILLSWGLYTRKNINITLIREKSNYFKMQNDFLYLNIPVLVQSFLIEFKNDDNKFDNEICQSNYNDNQICIDFIFISIFLGNDFLPNLFGINIASRGIEFLCICYKKCIHMNNSFKLINVVNNHISIEWKSVCIYLQQIYHCYQNEIIPEFYLDYINHEPKLRIQREYVEYEKLYPNIQREYFELENIGKKQDPLNLKNCSNEKDNYIVFTSNYYDRYFDMKSINDTKFHEHIVANYLTGFYWVIEYYLKYYYKQEHYTKKKNISFGYHYNYPQSPLPQYIIEYLTKYETVYYNEFLNEPFVPYNALNCHHCLQIILPKESSHLIPNNEKSDNSSESNDNIIYVKDYKHFYSECFAYIHT